MENKDKIKDYLILILGIVILVLFLVKCNNIAPDPIYIKGKDSTHIIEIPRPYEVIKWKTKTVLIADSMKHSPEDTIPIIPITRYYNDSTSDSNLTIHTHIKTKGTLEELGLSYVLKTPLRIEKTIFRTDTLIKVPKMSLYGGLSVQGNKSSFDIAPYINLNYKAKNIFYSYHIIDKKHQIGVGILLYKTKK